MMNDSTNTVSGATIYNRQTKQFEHLYYDRPEVLWARQADAERPSDATRIRVWCDYWTRAGERRTGFLFLDGGEVELYDELTKHQVDFSTELDQFFSNLHRQRDRFDPQQDSPSAG